MAFPPGVKRPGREGVRSTTCLQLMSRLGMRGAIASLPQYLFMAWYLVKHKDFTFTLQLQKVRNAGNLKASYSYNELQERF
jgi:hypothetical protein